MLFYFQHKRSPITEFPSFELNMTRFLCFKFLWVNVVFFLIRWFVLACHEFDQ